MSHQHSNKESELTLQEAIHNYRMILEFTYDCYEKLINDKEKEKDKEIKRTFSTYFFQLLAARDKVEDILSSQSYPLPEQIEEIKNLDQDFKTLRNKIPEENIVNTLKNIVNTFLQFLLKLPLLGKLASFIGFRIKNKDKTPITLNSIKEYSDKLSPHLSYQHSWWKNLKPLSKKLDWISKVITFICLFGIVVILLRNWSIIQLFEFGNSEILPLLVSGFVVSIVSGTFFSQGKKIIKSWLNSFNSDLAEWHDEIMAVVSIVVFLIIMWLFIFNLNNIGLEALRKGDELLKKRQYVAAEIEYKKALIYLDAPAPKNEELDPIKRITTYFSPNFIEQQHPLALFKLGQTYYEHLNLDEAQKYYVLALKNEDEEDSVFYIQYLTNLAKVLILKSYGLTSTDDNLDYNNNLGDKSKEAIDEQKEIVKEKQLKDAKFFLDLAQAKFLKRINVFTQKSPDQEYFEELNRLNLKKPENNKFDNSQNHWQKILPNEQYPISDIEIYDYERKLNRDFSGSKIVVRKDQKINQEITELELKIKDDNKQLEQRKKDSQEYNNLKNKIQENYKKLTEMTKYKTLFLEYLTTIKDLRFVYGMYELSYLKELTTTEQKDSSSYDLYYKLINKLNEAKNHLRISSSIASIHQFKKELSEEKLDGILYPDGKEKKSETLFEQITLQKDEKLKDLKNNGEQSQILKSLCYYRLSQFLSLELTTLFDKFQDQEVIEKLIEDKKSVLDKISGKDPNKDPNKAPNSETKYQKDAKKFGENILDKYLKNISYLNKQLLDLKTKKDEQLKNKQDLLNNKQTKPDDNTKIKKSEEYVKTLEENIKTLEENIKTLEENIKTFKKKNLEKLDEQMFENICYIDMDNEIPIEVLHRYEERILYDLRRIPGLPRNPG